MNIFLLAVPILMFSGLPQTIKLIKTKNSAGISILTYFLTVTGVGLVFTKAVLESQWEIAAGNGMSLLMVSLNLFLIIRYRRIQRLTEMCEQHNL